MVWPAHHMGGWSGEGCEAEWTAQGPHQRRQGTMPGGMAHWVAQVATWRMLYSSFHLLRTDSKRHIQKRARALDLRVNSAKFLPPKSTAWRAKRGALANVPSLSKSLFFCFLALDSLLLVSLICRKHSGHTGIHLPQKYYILMKSMTAQVNHCKGCH